MTRDDNEDRTDEIHSGDANNNDGGQALNKQYHISNNICLIYLTN